MRSITSNNILVIAPFYDIFTKEFTNEVANYTNQIYFFVHHNYLSEFSKFVSIGKYMNYVKRFTKDNIMNKKQT